MNNDPVVKKEGKKASEKFSEDVGKTFKSGLRTIVFSLAFLGVLYIDTFYLENSIKLPLPKSFEPSREFALYLVAVTTALVAFYSAISLISLSIKLVANFVLGVYLRGMVRFTYTLLLVGVVLGFYWIVVVKK